MLKKLLGSMKIKLQNFKNEWNYLKNLLNKLINKSIPFKNKELIF